MDNKMLVMSEANIQEAFNGLFFLKNSGGKYTIKTYEDNHNLGLELCRKDDNGDIHSVIALDMNAIYQQCKPERIIRAIYGEMLNALNKALRRFDDEYDLNEEVQPEKSYRDFYRQAREIIETATNNINAVHQAEKDAKENRTEKEIVKSFCAGFPPESALQLEIKNDCPF